MSENDSMELICAIARRAVDLAAKYGQKRDVLTLSISLSKWHDAEPLDWPGLLAASDADLGHDVFGIDRHMDRETGKPDDGCFLPRYGQPSGANARAKVGE